MNQPAPNWLVRVTLSGKVLSTRVVDAEDALAAGALALLSLKCGWGEFDSGKLTPGWFGRVAVEIKPISPDRERLALAEAGAMGTSDGLGA